MARAGGRAGKVLSSGRLSLPVRPITCKKKAAVRKSSTTSLDSLCSTDSEDQVVDINRGLDRCAALLHDILQCDSKENPMKPHRMPGAKGSTRPAIMKSKKSAGRKPTTSSHVYKEKGPLRWTLPSGLCAADVQGPSVSSPPLTLPSQNLDHVTTQMQHFQQASSQVTGISPPADGSEASAVYNCRLPTSTPTLSPQRPAHSQCVASHLAQLQQSQETLQDQASEAYTSECGPLTEIDETSADEDDAGSAVREISCQTSFHKKSPEKKLKTVKYLLEEIKSLVLDQGDMEAKRLVTELERSVSLLPAVVGSTNVHAEIALALQPLRSENAQLRRRLRILNQQLRVRERGSRSDEQNAEVTALQSMNETLQQQLSEAQRELETLRNRNQELMHSVEVQEEESRKAAHIIQEKEQEIRHMQQHQDVTATDRRKEVDEAVGKMKSVQFKLEASEKENQILEITLRQRDAEITRLRELTRTLQAGMAKLLCDLGKDVPKPKPGSSLTTAALGSYDRQAQSEQCSASTSIINYLKTLETDQVFTGAESVYSHTPLLPISSKGVDAEANDYHQISKSLDQQHPPGPPYSLHKPKAELGSDLCYVTSDETLYLPLVSSPCKSRSDVPLRHMCTPPQLYRAERDTGPSSHYKNGLSDSAKNPGAHRDSRSITHPTDGDTRISQSYPPPASQHPPTDSSMFEGKPDWSICSFSTFTSNDEQEFRKGLAALDANIAKLQRSLQNGGTRK
ncbi:coiled-coil domain-containing protein 14 isoform X3 [Engystomops pustulosus]|uniref:coiled-coil domain-containing protein 14 isoform X3 n=1 Tax=Engystomops pustulosus TaxID=76066 RepID=UPI003AFA4487